MHDFKIGSSHSPDVTHRELKSIKDDLENQAERVQKHEDKQRDVGKTLEDAHDWLQSHEECLGQLNETVGDLFQESIKEKEPPAQDAREETTSARGDPERPREHSRDHSSRRRTKPSGLPTPSRPGRLNRPPGARRGRLSPDADRARGKGPCKLTSAFGSPVAAERHPCRP